MMIRQMNVGEEDECLRVIKESFHTVAVDLGLTIENCPRHKSFITREVFDFYVSNNNVFFVNEIEGKIVGCFSLVNDGIGCVEINNLSVVPECRHNKLGEKSILFAKEKAKEWGATRVSLSIVDENEVLKNWYKAFGFVEIWKKKFDGFPFTSCFLEWSFVDDLFHQGTVRIETERLILDRFDYTDIMSMKRNWIADEDIQSMYAEPVYETEKKIKELVDKYVEKYTSNEYYRWAVILKETGECIGQIAFFLVDNKNRFAEIEYCIGKVFQNKGFATEATKAIIKFGFEKINFHKILISTKEINEASKHVIEKCNFVKEGVFRDYFFYKNKYVDRNYYSILKSEYINK